MRPRPTRRLGVLLAFAVVLGASASALSAPAVSFPTSEHRLAHHPASISYPVLDANGVRRGSASWRVTDAGGNCCEVLVAATRAGQLVEFGGTYPLVSDDKGKTFTQIRPALPSDAAGVDVEGTMLRSGEGTVVMAPGGSIVGVSWDPYSGDHLQSFFYDAVAKRWEYGEVPLHEPFYDREWLAVAKGPFTVMGQTVPWVSVVLSGFHRTIRLMSLDGVSYFRPTSGQLQAVAGSETRPLTGSPDADLDYMQGHAATGIAPVPGGGALSLPGPGDSSTCGTQYLTREAGWACYSADGFDVDGALHADSRGWLHDMAVKGRVVTYRISKDGGRSWRTSAFRVPGVGSSVVEWDFKAHGGLGLTAVALHVLKKDGLHQDMVMRIDTRAGTARLKGTYLVGRGDARYAVGIGTDDAQSDAPDERFDFASVAILPDGTIATSFADSKHGGATLAVLDSRG